MTIPECILSIVLVYAFCRLMLPVLEAAEREKQRHDKE
jgi:hypothetical protein